LPTGPATKPIDMPIVPGGSPLIHGGAAWRGVTDESGLFDAAVVGGDYMLCVEPDDFEHLDPCKWAPGPAITVGAGPKTQAGAIVIRKGIPLRVILEDPQILLGDELSVRAGVNVEVGLQRANGIFEPIRLEKAQVAGSGFVYQYAAAIPAGEEVRAMLISHGYTVQDERGQAIRMGGQVTVVRGSAGERERQIRFRVTGRAGGGR
jgi:hypothetical protein